MKTAISVPDPLFEKVERRLIDLGMSRSRFYATAAQRFLDELDAASLTIEIDAALHSLNADAVTRVAADSERAELTQHALRRLAQLTNGDEW
jgi:metal-responsive CopG/Arc/MetJ family transcriptional regulator